MILYRLSKPRARTFIIIEEDLEMDDEGWFIAIKHYNIKDDLLNYESCITKNDIQTRLRSLQNTGWEIDEEHKK